MNKKIIQISLLSSILLASSSFANVLKFDAAHLNGNLTRINLTKFKNITINNPAICYMAVDLVGTTGTIYGDEYDSMDQINNETQNSAEALKEVDEGTNEMGIGKFKEIRNTAGYKIPACAYKIQYTFSN